MGDLGTDLRSPDSLSAGPHSLPSTDTNAQKMNRVDRQINETHLFNPKPDNGAASQTLTAATPTYGLE